MPARLHGVYAIADLAAGATVEGVLTRARAVLEGGVRLLQCRAKHATAAERHALARGLRDLTRAHSALLFINDDIELAAQVGADGVHLGREDAGVAVARLRLGPQALIGATCHDSLESGWDAVAAGADYLAFGSVYASPTKPAATRVPFSVLREASRTLPRPVCAIGGIDAANAAEVLSTGVHMLAVGAGLFAASDPAQVARQIQAAFRPV